MKNSLIFLSLFLSGHLLAQVPAANTIRIPQSNGSKFVNRDILPDAAGVLGWTGTTLGKIYTSSGGNGAADNGKLVLYSGLGGGITATTGITVKPFGGGVEASTLQAVGWQFFDGTNTLMVRPPTLTADRDLFFPDADGNLISTGDTGTVTNVMLAGSIDPLKITGTAAVLGANTFTGAQVLSANGAASTPAAKVSGTIYSGGTATTTKPLVLIEPSASTSTNWGTGGTVFGVNSTLSGSTTNLIDVQTGAGNNVNRLRYYVNTYGYLSLYSPSGGELALANQYGVLSVGLSGTAVNVTLYSSGTAEQAGYYCVNSNGTTTYFGLLQTGTAHQVQLGQSATADVDANDQLFKGPDAAAGVGTNRNGGDVTFASGRSTGSGTSAVVFQTPTPGASGTTEGSLTTRFSVNSVNANFFSPPKLPGYTVATLPTGVGVGTMAYVTDALAPAWGATVVGGGTVVIPVFYDGVNWITN